MEIGVGIHVETHVVIHLGGHARFLWGACAKPFEAPAVDCRESRLVPVGRPAMAMDSNWIRIMLYTFGIMPCRKGQLNWYPFEAASWLRPLKSDRVVEVSILV